MGGSPLSTSVAYKAPIADGKICSPDFAVSDREAVTTGMVSASTTYYGGMSVRVRRCVTSALIKAYAPGAIAPKWSAYRNAAPTSRRDSTVGPDRSGIEEMSKTS